MAEAADGLQSGEISAESEAGKAIASLWALADAKAASNRGTQATALSSPVTKYAILVAGTAAALVSSGIWSEWGDNRTSVSSTSFAPALARKIRGVLLSRVAFDTAYAQCSQQIKGRVSGDALWTIMCGQWAEGVAQHFTDFLHPARVHRVGPDGNSENPYTPDAAFASGQTSSVGEVCVLNDVPLVRHMLKAEFMSSITSAIGHQPVQDKDTEDARYR